MSAREVTPEMYSRVFEGHAEGALILEDLVARFCGNPYVKGGKEAERESTYRSGQGSVLHYVLGKINQANGEYNDRSSSDN